MAIKKFTPQNSDKFTGKEPGDQLLGKFGHLNYLLQQVNNSVVNELGTPAFRSDILANQPAAGEVGRIFLSTDTGAFYRDNGTSWELVGTPSLVTTNRQNASYILALSDRSKLVEMNVGSANTLTVPTNASVPFAIGTKIDVIQIGTGQTSISPALGVTLNSFNGWQKINGRYGTATLIKIATNEWYLFGNLNA